MFNSNEVEIKPLEAALLTLKIYLFTLRLTKIH